MNFRLAIFETHPIQYKVPWFRALTDTENVELTVFYSMIPTRKQQGDGFGVAFEWDVPLLNGYHYQLLENNARRPSVTRFFGCDTPGIYTLLRSSSIPFDAAIINGWVTKSCLQALWACRRMGIPTILRCEANDMKPRAWWKTLAHRFILKQFNAFIAIGSSNRDFYIRRGVNPSSIVEGFYCIDGARFTEAGRKWVTDKAAIRGEWDIPESAVCFLFCGKFEDKKRPLDLVKAFDKMSAGLSAHLLMVGDGPLRHVCESYALEHNLNVTFTGFLNQREMPKAYAACDCLVLPSDYGETWGLVVNEAMACGLPAMVSDRVGCHSDLVHPGKTGAVFPFGDIDRLAALLQEQTLNPLKLIEMGAKARRLIEHYSIENLTRGTLEALQAVTGKQP